MRWRTPKEEARGPQISAHGEEYGFNKVQRKLKRGLKRGSYIRQFYKRTKENKPKMEKLIRKLNKEA